MSTQVSTIIYDIHFKYAPLSTTDIDILTTKKKI